MDPALVSASARTTVTFEDGLGERHQVLDSVRQEPVEMFCLRGALTAVPSFEFALRERVSRLAPFRHACYAQIVSVERLKDKTSTLAVVSEYRPGVRLSELLAFAEQGGASLDIDAALCLVRQLVPAVALLHESAPDIAHGAIGPERIVVTPGARLVVVEHVLGSALEQLRFSHERYWKELHVPVPRSAGAARFDHRADVMQIGLVALALVLGRRIADDEYPARIAEVVASTWAISARGGLEPLPAGLRSWLTRALQIDSKNWFRSAVEAQEELERVLGESDYLAAPATLEAFMAEYAAAHEGTTPVELPVLTPVAPPAPVMTHPMPAAVTRPQPPSAAHTFQPPPQAASQTPIAAPPVTAPIAARPSPGSAFAHVPAPMPASSPRPAVQAPGAPAASSARQPARRDATMPPVPEPVTRYEEPPMQKKSSRWPLVAAALALIALAGGGLAATRFYAAPTVPASNEGTLVVNTNPPGAQVFVDGVDRGVTPLTVSLNAGNHSMEVRGDGEPRVMPITISAGGQVAQFIDMPKGAATLGQLQVKTEPAGARVSVDGVARGVAPLTVPDLQPGEHEVLVEGELGSMKQTVVVEAGITASLMVPLGAPEGAPVSGWISVTAPADVQVFEGGRLVGSSQSERLMVSAGRHDLEIVNQTLGYRTNRTVQVSPGRVTAIKVDFPKGTIAMNAIPWADVFVDGAKVGETPIGKLELVIGSHEIVFRNPDLGEQRHAVTITADKPARLSVDLRKR